MKIPLNKKIFTEDPYQKFGEIHSVDPELWRDMYHKRYLWYEYEIPILTEYFNLKTGKALAERTIRRWVKRTEIYCKAQKAITMGAQEVTDEFFEGMTRLEIEELCK